MAVDVSAIKGKILELAGQEPALHAVFLFGSTVEGFSGERSDLDFGIVIGDGRQKVDLKEELRLGVLFSEKLRKEVDVVILNNASLAFAYRVLSLGVLLFERQREELSDYIERVMDHYLDFLVRIKRYEKEFDEGLRRHYGRRNPSDR